jgi:heterodisulfide reductase subunit A-like polyferredoxin
VVLSVGMGPADGAPRVAELFGLAQDEFGFFTSRRPTLVAAGTPVFAAGTPVFAAGTCVEPQSIVDSIASGRAAAQELLVRLSPSRAIPARGASA